ncbi:hypothetical protein AAFC00_005027 [Neodothiora populina]|uniref:FMN hydroxy acid dehydrogenase domain-containing protein n=1 Tax=Neodothiora populina TaxID=2781224 RepID=A0ABR3P3Z0_9PEZI
MEETGDPITVAEIQGIAKHKLPSNVYNYYACGADEEKALARNQAMFDRLLIRPRVMMDVSHIDTSVSVFGRHYPCPIAFAPSAMQKLAGPAGETDVAVAAANLNLNMTLSSQSTTSLEDIAQIRCRKQEAPDQWFQLYLTKDPQQSISLIKRASAMGYKALVLTVDTPILGNRINERKTPLVLPEGLSLANFPENADSATPRRPTYERLLLDARTAAEAEEVIKTAGPILHSPCLTWHESISWLRSVTDMKIILKGIMTEEDAELAIKWGADALIVSNHGGRQLDGIPSTIEVLPAIAQAVRGRIPVVFDGGVRRGSDVFKAVALGADLVLIGRPVLWGLAYNGSKGVETVANILERELYRTMVLSGVTNIRNIRQSSLAVAKRDGFGVARL